MYVFENTPQKSDLLNSTAVLGVFCLQESPQVKDRKLFVRVLKGKLGDHKTEPGNANQVLASG